MNRMVFAVLAILPLLTWADSHRAKDWPEGSAMHTGHLAKERLANADKELNRVYRQLLKELPKDESDNFPRKALVDAQKAWVRYRDASCALVGEVTGGVRMWKSTYSVLCEAEETERRTAELKKLLEGGS